MEHHLSGESFNGGEDNNLINFNDNDNTLVGRSQSPLTEAQLTLFIMDVEVLICRRNVIIFRSLFIEESVIEKADPPPYGSAIETKRIKKARQSCVGFATWAFSSIAGEDNQLVRM